MARDLRVLAWITEGGCEARVDAVNAMGETALSEAAYAADEDMGALLLQRGAKPDSLDRYGKSPICYAAARGAAGLVGRLIGAGVDPHAHYDSFGFREGRNPNAWFDTAGYLAHYADVAAAGVNPLQHYDEFGFRDHLTPQRSNGLRAMVERIRADARAALATAS